MEQISRRIEKLERMARSPEKIERIYIEADGIEYIGEGIVGEGKIFYPYMKNCENNRIK